jgi:hypothetical protein
MERSVRVDDVRVESSLLRHRSLLPRHSVLLLLGCGSGDFWAACLHIGIGSSRIGITRVCKLGLALDISVLCFVICPSAPNEVYVLRRYVISTNHWLMPFSILAISARSSYYI